MQQVVDDPPFLSVGTEVSAKYKGAFCEAKVRKVVRNIKCKIAYKQGLGSGTVSDDLIKGLLRVGATVEVKHPDKRDLVEATITKIQDCSQYTVVFDDGDITTLRRTALCLKSGRHFNESETLDQLPLTHPEHFGNPVIGGRRGRRSRHFQDSSSGDEDEQDSKHVINEKEEHIGKVVCVESTDSKKKDKEKWFPGLVVAPTAQVTVRIRVKDEYLVRSFKDGRYYTVPKKEAMEFTREMAAKHDGLGVQAAIEYLDNDILPTHWDRDALFGLSNSSSEYEGELDSDSSDDEPREEKDHFVAQLYKYMDDRGTPLNKVPSITNKDVDLYRLFRAVQKVGGYNRVTSQNQWKAITMRLGFNPATVSVTNLVKQAYKKFLQPFEEFDRKLGCSMSMTPRNANRTKGRSLVRANSVASPKLEIKEVKIMPQVEELETVSELNIDSTKTKRKSSTSSGKVKAIIEKFEEKSKEECDVPKVKAIIKEEQATIPTSILGVSKKEKSAKKQPQADEKRPRKRKDEEKDGYNEKSIEIPAISEFPVEVGDKLKVYYHEKKVTYEAKVIEISTQQGTTLYLVHYTGWNTRYDEWIPKERIAENFSTSKSKRNKGHSIKSANNLHPPNDGTKQMEKISPASSFLQQQKGQGTSKRGRWRSDSQPPRSLTPSSTFSNRTKSPAPTQRRITRAQPGLLRRTSNNISDISVPSSSESDSDETTTKSLNDQSKNAHDMPNQEIEDIENVPEIKTELSWNSIQSETKDHNMKDIKGRDYDLNLIRSELKGFKELKPSSSDGEFSPDVSSEKKSNDIFEFVQEHDDEKIINVSPPIPKNNAKDLKSSTEISSETDSLADDDSQSSDKTTSLENMTEKLQNKINLQKLAQMRCFDQITTGKPPEKILTTKSTGLEKIIKKAVAEKDAKKTKSMIIQTENTNIELRAQTKAAKSITQPSVLSQLDIKNSSKVERKISAIDKTIFIKQSQKEISLCDPHPSRNYTIPEKIPKDLLQPIIAEKIGESSDIYEFKEPEPFEFEQRKLTSTANIEIEKKNKKINKPSTDTIQDPKAISTISQNKKGRKSPIKDNENLKIVKLDDSALIAEHSTSLTNLILPSFSETTFDALRKSPSFNLNITPPSEEFLKQDSTQSGQFRSSSPNQKHFPFISPFVETTKLVESNIFDINSDVDNVKGDIKDEKTIVNKVELETIKKILLSDSNFDLDPPKIGKPSSIADKVLKALNQQKQEEKIKDEFGSMSATETSNSSTIITEPPKMELPIVIKREIDISLKKPLLSSPEQKLDILESIAPKNNDLSETIQKLESVIQKNSNVDHFEDDSSDSTDSEQRLVIEDDSRSSETNQIETINEVSLDNLKKKEFFDEKGKENLVKDEHFSFASKFTKGIYGTQTSNFANSSILSDSTIQPVVEILPTFKFEGFGTLNQNKFCDEIPNSILKKEELMSTYDSQIMHRESINLLLCEETIPGSPTPAKDILDNKSCLHPIESDIKPIPMDIESGPFDATIEMIQKKLSQSQSHTPNSSPRDSISQYDSSEESKRQNDHDNDLTNKKRKRNCKHTESEVLLKKRKATSNFSKKTHGSESDENSDANVSPKNFLRQTKYCQLNFIVQLDPAMNPNQRIGVLRKKIQELRKTYSTVKAELASIDRRRKKLRRREREKKNQQKINTS